MRCARVATVLVTWNPAPAGLADALAAHVAMGVERVLVVDNGSDNAAQVASTVESLQSAALEYLPQGDNLGVAAAQNIGIERALSLGCSHVLLFDQDSVPRATLLGSLLSTERKLLAAGVAVGAVGSNPRDPRTGRLYPQIRLRGPLMLKRFADPSDARPLEVSFIIASGALIRSEVLRAVGPMNAKFFIDAVDIEWCLRARSRGFGIFVAPSAILSHPIGERTERWFGRDIAIHSPLRRYYIARNALLMSRLPWVPLGFRARSAWSVFFRAPLFLGVVGFDPRYVRAMSAGVRDGLRGRGGRYHGQFGCTAAFGGPASRSSC